MMRGEDRKHHFKKTTDLENGRRRREETTTQIRKSKKEEQLMKRRQAPMQQLKGKEKDEKHYTMEDIPSLMVVFRSGTQNNDEILKAVRGFRRMLSVEVNPPVNQVLDAGALPYLVKFLQHYEQQHIVFEAAWALTNIASTHRTKAVVEADVMHPLIRLLDHHQASIREQAAWCLGNIAGDSHELRDHVLQEGALHGLLKNLSDPGSMSLLSNVTWAISNLCRGKPTPRMELIGDAMAPLATLLHRNATEEVLVDAVWALSYLADGDDDRIQKVMDTGVTPRLVELLEQGKKTELMNPLVRTLGNFVTGTDSQTQAVINAGIIPKLLQLLEHKSRNIRKESCWVVSNIAAGNPSQINSVLMQVGLVDKVVDLALHDRWEVKKEAIWVIANIFTMGDDYHIRKLVQLDGLEPMVQALVQGTEVKIILAVLEALDRVLATSQRLGLNWENAIDELSGIDILEELQQHASDKVYDASVKILENYFGVDDEEDENIAPSEENGVFGFGVSNPAPRKQLFPESSENGNNTFFGQSSSTVNMQL